MPYSIKIQGTEETENALTLLGTAALGVAACGVYEGAGVVADQIGHGVQGISTAPFKWAKPGEKRLPSPEEKAALMGAAYGIATFRKNGTEVQTIVGFQSAGYVSVGWNHMANSSRTKYKMQNGKVKHTSKVQGKAVRMKPIPVIANAINSGTSFMQKQPFFRKAMSSSKGGAEAAIEGYIKAQMETFNQMFAG